MNRTRNSERISIQNQKTTSEFCIFLTCNEELKKTDFNKITELSKFIEKQHIFL